MKEILKTFTHPFDHTLAEFQPTSVSNRGVLFVKDLVGFIQAVGYAKHKLINDNNSLVFFRGQCKLYPNSLSASLFRNCTKSNGVKKRLDAIKAYVAEMKKFKTFKDFDDSIIEGLLQQYGVATSWLDVVDNLWIALWFACHRAISYNNDLHSWCHYQRRVPNNESNLDRFAYVLLIQMPQGTQETMVPGLLKSKQAECIDLRCAIPSYYIRPHIQHGLLIRKLSLRGRVFPKMDDMLVGIIKIRLCDALQWLGDSCMLSASNLFMSPVLDRGFGELLKAEQHLSFNFQQFS